MDEQIKPVAWRTKTPHGWVVGKTPRSSYDEPLYSQQSIEALRAEVESAKRMTETVHESLRIAVANELAAEARAERLAEVLALLPDDSGMIEHSPEEGPFMFCCGREVTYDRLHGPICIHDEECWYARMRALRDHDQDR